MAIVVESGTGTDSTANSYVTLAESDTYFENKGFTTWTDGDDDDKEYAILRACSYMELLDWKGYKSLSTNPLVWPRKCVQDRDGYDIDSTTIPTQLKYAQMELAYRYFSGKDPMADIESGSSYVTREVVGPIEVSYASGYSANIKFPEVEALLRPWLNSSLSVVVERA